MYNDPNQPQPPPYGGQPDWRQQPPPEYGQPPPPYGQPQWGQQPPPPPPYAQTQYGPPPYGVPPMPDYPQPQPQQPTQSRRALWIVLGIFGGLIVLGLIGCVVFFVLIGTAAQRTISTVTTSIEKTETAVSSSSGPEVTVQQYYTAIQSQDYVTAYSYLESNLTTTNGQALTQQLFTQAAMSQDSSSGQVTGFTVTADPNDSTKFTVSVTRGTNAPYTVNIQVTMVGSDWKISSYDGI